METIRVLCSLLKKVENFSELKMFFCSNGVIKEIIRVATLTIEIFVLYLFFIITHLKEFTNIETCQKLH